MLFCLPAVFMQPPVITRRGRQIGLMILHAINKQGCFQSQILYFAFSAPAKLFAYECRIGNMPSYSSIYKTLRSLADQEARVTRDVGRDLSKWGSMRIDHVQQWIQMQDLRIGQESRMLVGVATTYFEIDPDLFVLGAADLDDKLARIAENKRRHVTVEMFLKLITMNISRRLGFFTGYGRWSTSQNWLNTSPMFLFSSAPALQSTACGW
jgi:hypothetical protein